MDASLYNAIMSRSQQSPPPFPTHILPSSIPFRHRLGSFPLTHPDRASSPPPLSTSVDSAASASTPPRLTHPSPSTLRCKHCSTDLAFAAQIVSKGFTGRHGRAFLVSAPIFSATPTTPSSPQEGFPATPGNLVNIRVGHPENRQLVTGSHVVADITCRVCNTKVGWKYVDAREQAQKYKVGKFILETARVVGWRAWEFEEEDTSNNTTRSLAPHEYIPEKSYSGGKSSPTKTAPGSGDHFGGGVDDGLEEVSDEEPIVFDSGDEDECEDIFAGTWNVDAVRKRRRLRRAIAARAKA